MHQPRNPPPVHLRHLAALDGLRGVAVLAVLGYHAEVAQLPGGFLGVELFFVVSGFLITSLLLAEHRSTGTIDLRRFWVRRARRLLPALAVLLAAVAVVVRVALPEELARTRGGLLAAVAYVTNWELIWSGRSYFESLGRPPLLQHLWSLAVEEQYYLLWPVVVSVLLALRGRRAVVWACASAVVGSTALMWVLLDPAAPSRVYYGTDTRAAGLAMGGLLATTLVGVRAPRPAPTARRVLDVAGVVSLAVVVGAMVTTSEYELGLYRGGFLAFGSASALLLFTVTVPGSVVARGLAAGPLVWVGLRSYGLYLWHWPVYQLTRPGLDLDPGLTGPTLLALRLGVTFAVAEVSLRLVERPARDGAIGRWWAAVRDGSAPAPSRRLTAPRVAAAGVAAASLAVVAAYAAVPAPPSDAELAASIGRPDPAGASADQGPTVPAGAVHSTGRGRSGAVAPAWPAEPVVPPVLDQPPDAHRASPAVPHLVGPPASPVSQVAPGPAPAPAPRPVHAVGDSVLLASAEALLEVFEGGVTIDAVVGRQPGDGVTAVEAWAPANPGVDLVVSLGSNGLLRDTDVDRIMAAAGADRQVVWLTVAVPRRWEAPSNEVLRQRVPQHPNAQLVDWHDQVAADPSLLGRDHVHPRGHGTRALAASVRAAFGW